MAAWLCEFLQLIHYIYIRMVYKHNNTIYVQNTAKDYQVHV